MFDESKHPREKDGKFTDGNGTYDSRDDFATTARRVKGATGGKDRKANADPEDKTTIKEQVKAGMDKIKDTKVLAEIPESDLKTDFKTAITALRVKLAKNGGVVSRDGFGDIQVGSRLKKAAKYIRTAAEVAAVSAIPAVIKNGVFLDEHKSHKGRGYPTYLFAGKVSVGGKEGVMAVAVKKTTGNFYTIHRVLTPDGRDLKIENDTD